MAAVRIKSIPGASLMSTMFPDPLEYASRLLRLNYVHPVWWTAYKMSPPKDVYPLEKMPHIKLPVDRLIRKTFQRIPMLRKEKYEIANPDYSPLAVRLALTQQRLMDEEGYEEDKAFEKCEHDIFKEELYYFAKTIRDNPGNYFKLTSKEMKHFYIHDIINEVSHLQEQIKSGADPATVVRDHLKSDKQVLKKVLEQRNVKFPQYDYSLGNYAKDGKIRYTPRKTVYDEQAEYDIDAAIAGAHITGYHENQRFIKTGVQVPATVLLSNIKICDPALEVTEDYPWTPNMLLDSSDEESHIAAFDKDYFLHTEILENIAKIDAFKQEDAQILELLEAEKAAQKQ